MHDSGQTHRSGPITKAGRRELRHARVEAAWIAVETNPFWQVQFERLCRRMHQNQAILAMARQLLVVIWHVLTERVSDQQADPDMVAFPHRGPAGKLMTWSWKLTDEQRGGLTSRQFVRYGVLRLDLGHDLTHVVRGRARRLIAPPEQVLVLQRELRPPD